MEDAVFKPVSVAMVLLITAPSVVSMIASFIASVYFVAMLKLNVVDVKYGGDWGYFFKSVFTRKSKGNGSTED